MSSFYTDTVLSARDTLQMETDAKPMHLVFAATQRNFQDWRKSHSIPLAQAQRVTSYEQLGVMHRLDPTKYIWHVLEGFRGADLIMAARTRGMPLTQDYEPIYVVEDS